MSNKGGIVGVCGIAVLGFCLADAYVDDIRQRKKIKLLKQTINDQKVQIDRMEKHIKRTNREKQEIKNKVNALVQKNMDRFGSIVINQNEIT